MLPKVAVEVVRGGEFVAVFMTRVMAMSKVAAMVVMMRSW